MSEIRTTNIDGQEFVTLTDYLRLKEIAHDELKELKETAETVKELERENKKLKEKIEQIKETYIKFEDSEKEYNKGLGELDQLIMNR